MAELLKQTVSKRELDEGIIPINMVLCEQYYSNEGLTTKSGIIIGVNKELIYADPDNLDDDSTHAADLAEVSMIVYKTPQKLYFNTEDREKSMPWLTDMALEKGWEIWTNTIDSLNAVTLVCDGKTYKLISYSDIYCARYRITLTKIMFAIKVRMLNGYVLVTLKNKESLSGFDVISEECLDKTKGVISYIGNPVKEYLNPDYSHIEDLRTGDTVLFNPKAGIWALERQKYASRFDDKQIYYVVHRKDINAVLSRK
jgi:hypothetical protein